MSERVLSGWTEREMRASVSRLRDQEDWGLAGLAQALISEVTALRTRAEQAERERDIARANYQEVYGLEADRDALRAEAGRLREALEKLAAAGRKSLHDRESTKALWADFVEEVANEALSSTPLFAAAGGAKEKGVRWMSKFFVVYSDDKSEEFEATGYRVDGAFLNFYHDSARRDFERGRLVYTSVKTISAYNLKSVEVLLDETKV